MKVIEEFNEFTWDMVRALPKANYYYQYDIPFKILCKPNLSPIYFQLTDIVEEYDRFSGLNPPSTYGIDRPDFSLSDWIPPLLNDTWSGYLSFEKPTIIIQNKYAVEWNQGVFNYFPIDFLHEIFTTYKARFQIIYIRPKGSEKNYYEDENKIIDFKDHEFIKKTHPEVLTIQDLMLEYPNLDYNLLQFAIHSTSNIHITVSGGNACIASYFGGDTFIFDSPKGSGAGRGIWKTDSWLKELSGAKIHGHNDYNSLFKNVVSTIK